MTDSTARPLPGARALSRGLRGSLLLSAALLLATGCEENSSPTRDPIPAGIPPPRYQATIQRTAYGIPHITATSLASVGFGQGYAFAQDNACVLADQVVKVRGERSRFLGPGPSESFVGSDFAYRSLDLLARGQAAFDAQPADVKAMLEGYAAGYNKYLYDTGVANIPGSCAGKAWVRPITPGELMAYHLNLSLTGSSFQFIPAIAATQPPATTGGLRPEPLLEQLAAMRAQDVGSNGWAIGAERTANGRGMVLANPHFPWEGEQRLWESHLTVPGVLNVYGVGLMGVPGVLIGFNDNVAWTHTFSYGQRFTLYGLKFVSGSTTRYVYGSGEKELVGKAITLQVLQPDGSLKDVTRTMYSSHYGPIISWTAQGAVSYRDANLDNQTFIAQFHFMNRARSLAEFKDVYATYQGIPWVNTMATDRGGNTWYTDASPTPNLSAGAIARWQGAIRLGDPLTVQFYNQGLVFLDGSNPDNEWVVEPGARSPGLIPFSKAPQLSRRDFVFNANDSYWLANPAAPLTGFSPLVGPERVPQSPRTRMNAILLTEAREGGASGADGRFTLAELQAAIYSDRALTSELLREQVVARCQNVTTVDVSGTPVDISEACTRLAAWDGNFNAESVGAVVWREFIGAFTDTETKDKGGLFSVAFSPDAPVATPNTLTPAPGSGDDTVLVGLAKAVQALGKAGVALNAPLGQVQYAPRAGQRFGLHGGQGREGVANVVSFSDLKSTAEPGTTRGPRINTRTGLTADGYIVNNGTSFLMTFSYTDTGVDAAAVLTYGQSEVVGSQHFNDQLDQLYTKKQWRKLLFTDAEISADPGRTEQVVKGF